MTSFFSSSPRPRWLNRMLRDRSRSTSCSAFHDGAASSGASNSFSIQAEYRFSVARFQLSRSGQTLPCRARWPAAACRLHGDLARDGGALAGAPSRASVACHVPAAGAATSANQKYGGPPCALARFGRDVPSGAISENSPSSGFSAANDHAQGRALPRRERRGEDGEPGRVLASRRSLGLRVRCGTENAAGDQQRCRRNSSNLACTNQSSPRVLPRPK